MKVEIWSDIACPFCYIGKKKFELALTSFAFSDKIEVVYKSFQLDPEYHFKEGETVYSYLTSKKGMSIDQVKQMTTHIEEMANEVGISIHFKRNIPANTHDAHRLIHAGASENKANDVVEGLFEGHFCEGKNIELKDVLKSIGLKAGLSDSKVEDLLTTDDYAYDVAQDMLESRNLGIRGVPFFLFNRQFAISGAQPVESFTDALTQSYEAWQRDPDSFVLSDKHGASCNAENCDF